MKLILANLLIRITKCSIHSQGTSLILTWRLKHDTISWTLHASVDKKTIITKNNKVKEVSHYINPQRYYKK